MNRTDFIEIMKAQAEAMRKEMAGLKAELNNRMKEKGGYDYSLSHRLTKIGHEISAIENAIREMEMA